MISFVLGINSRSTRGSGNSQGTDQGKAVSRNQGPVVQSIVSLMSSLRDLVKCFTTL